MAGRSDRRRRRRLLVVNPTGLLGGAEVVLDRLVEAAGDDNWQMIAAMPDGRLADRLRTRGLVVVRIPDLKLPGGPKILAIARALLRTISAARTLRRAAQGQDAVVANGLFALPALRIARPRCPIIAMVHDIIDRPVYRVITQICGGIVTVAVAPSEAAARPLREHGLHVRIVRNGAQWPVDPAPTEQPNPPVVGELAALTPPKAQDLLLEAVARLRRPDVIVELAGDALPKDGPYAERLRTRALLPDLAGRVRFLGRAEDALAVLRGWSVAVLPSVYPESFGLAVLEAMSVGVPVVATQDGGPAELVGDAGLLVPPGDIAALAGAIERLLDDRDLWQRCREAGRRIVEATYTLADQQVALRDVLNQVAKKTNMPAR